MTGKFELVWKVDYQISDSRESEFYFRDKNKVTPYFHC
jgi:hypothetical protein